MNTSGLRSISVLALSTAIAFGGAVAASAAELPDTSTAPTSTGNDPQKVAETQKWMESRGYEENQSSTISPSYKEGGASTDAILFGNGRLSAQNFANLTPYSCCVGDIATGFVSYATFGFAGIGVTVNGDSYASWLGSTPYNPTSTTLTSDISVAGAGGGSVGSAGGEVTIAGNHIYITNTSNNAWQTTQAYFGVQFSGPIISVSEATTANFTFGAASFAVSAA